MANTSPTTPLAEISREPKLCDRKMDDASYYSYINPSSLEKEDPAKPSPLARLVDSCDRFGKELGLGEFSSILRGLVCEGAAMPVAGQKRSSDPAASAGRHQASAKMRRLQLHPHPPHLLLLPPPQTEPVNLSKTVDTQLGGESALPPSNHRSSSSSLLITQLLLLGDLLPHLLASGPDVAPSHSFALPLVLAPPSLQAKTTFLS
ncbi:unnamed protein product [Mesocestoides corti]|uniref:Mediator of RNA polymerase II transcription subunit 19 n=1 Tax=Mesocestoides corti TaxID=53468 RepID=A0A0R3U7J2_MESCO|nr:unnamed protein product [Mesocestoides corti]